MLWMAVGATATIVGSRWTKRKARAVREQVTPGELGRRLSERARAAAGEGRAAMAETEARLRAELARRSSSGP
jgi:hypothetical protein